MDTLVGYRFAMNTQEKDDEIYGKGNTSSAEFWEYDTRLGRRWNLDPIIKPWQSGYLCFSNNPIIMVDPNGDADFYTEWGKKVGTDGVDNGAIYVLTTKSDIKKAKDSYFGKGIKGFSNILCGNGGKGKIQISEFKGDIVPLPSLEVRTKIGQAVERSSKPTLDDIQGGYHEEGGIFGKDANGIEKVVDAKAGAYSNPKFDSKAGIDLSILTNSAIITDVKGTFHVHPEGTITENTGGVASTEKEKYSFVQNPSNKDVRTAKNDGNTSGYSIVVGAGDKTVYIYGTKEQNKSGFNHRATFPLSKFLSVGNEKQKAK